MKCPTCKSLDGVREIVYGLPIEPLDEEKYATGGCCISDEDPTRTCIECGWKGEFVNNIGPGLRIFDPEGHQTFLDKEK